MRDLWLPEVHPSRLPLFHKEPSGWLPVRWYSENIEAVRRALMLSLHVSCSLMIAGLSDVWVEMCVISVGQNIGSDNRMSRT
jgi:hypothetical protein